MFGINSIYRTAVFPCGTKCSPSPQEVVGVGVKVQCTKRQVAGVVLSDLLCYFTSFMCFLLCFCSLACPTMETTQPLHSQITAFPAWIIVTFLNSVRRTPIASSASCLCPSFSPSSASWGWQETCSSSSLISTSSDSRP